MRIVARTQAGVALVGAVLGLTFATLSTFDYIQHLDRQLHAVHCSFIPGLTGGAQAENPCREAMYSSYSALLRGSWWGGVPISLFALGLYVFFAAFALTLLLARERGSRRAWEFLGLASLGPVVVSIIMAIISAAKLGTFCKTCVGLYVASIVLAVGAVWGMLLVRRSSAEAGLAAAAPPEGGSATRGVLAWGGLLAACAIFPVLVYVAALPDYRAKLTECGKLSHPRDRSGALVKLRTLHPKRAVTVFVDPLCPTCKALHARLDAEGALENLDVSLALFPLDSTCNWMIDRSLHPGGCLLSRVVLCSDSRAREALEWIFDHQEDLGRAGKAGEAQLRALVRERFGASLDACLDSRRTRVRLNNLLQYAVDNHVPVSTPQLYLGEQRICDEDTDLGLPYTLAQLAPEVLQ